jgi:hypothetical protein
MLVQISGPRDNGSTYREGAPNLSRITTLGSAGPQKNLFEIEEVSSDFHLRQKSTRSNFPSKKSLSEIKALGRLNGFVVGSVFWLFVIASFRKNL